MDVNETKKNQTAGDLVEILSQMVEKATTAAELEALTAAAQIVAAQGAERNVGRTRKNRMLGRGGGESVTRRIKVRIDTGCVTEAYDTAPWELYSVVTFASEQMPRSFEEAKRLRDNYRRRLMRSCPAGDVRMELLGIRGGRWKIEMRSRGIPAAVIHGKMGKGGIWMQTAPPRRKVEYDKSRLVVRCCGRAVRKRPEGWKAP